MLSYFFFYDTNTNQAITMCCVLCNLCCQETFQSQRVLQVIALRCVKHLPQWMQHKSLEIMTRCSRRVHTHYCYTTQWTRNSIQSLTFHCLEGILRELNMQEIDFSFLFFCAKAIASYTRYPRKLSAVEFGKQSNATCQCNSVHNNCTPTFVWTKRKKKGTT